MFGDFDGTVRFYRWTRVLRAGNAMAQSWADA